MHLTFINLTLLLLIIRSTSSSNQQHVLHFDDDQSQPISQDSTIPSGVPKPTGLTAWVIQRLTGWNDTVVSKLTGQIAPRAPHPFVVSITDENYEHVIGSDLDLIRPGWGSQDDTIWIVVVSATDRISGVFDETFDELASNASQAIYPPPTKTRDDEITVRQLSSDDPFLFPPHLRFGRIDYMGKTDVILTKWLIFKCPVMVIITKKGQELRFFKIGGMPPALDHLSQFLREEKWTYKPIWNSSFSPGGSREWVLELLGKAFKAFHDVVERVPGWLLMMITSVLGTSLMQFLHRQSAPSVPRKKPVSSSTSSSSNVPSGEQNTDQLKAELAKAAVELAQTAARRGKDSKTSQTGSSAIDSSEPLRRRNAH